MERHIVHLDLDTFFVSVERLLNSELNGKPVLVGGTSGRGVVTSCSYEARKFGVHSAMSMKAALRLCPEAVTVKGSYESYSKYSKMVTEILLDNAPIVEKASIDEHYLDLTGMDKYFGCYKWSHELRQKIIKETGLPISFGLSSNKTVSKVATGQAKPNGAIYVEAGREKLFLAPLSLRKIPMVGKKAFGKLQQRNIETVGAVQQMPMEEMLEILGENGVMIWNKCNAIDNSQVSSYREARSISKEQTFHQDTMDMAFLRTVVIRAVDELAFDLRKRNRLTGCVGVKLRYGNWDTYIQQSTVPYTSSTRMMTEQALELLYKLYTKSIGVRLVGVKLTNLVQGSYQIDLFKDTVRDTDLCRALDGIKNRFGTDYVLKAVMLNGMRRRR